MLISDIIIPKEIEEKLNQKHSVLIDEVEEIFANKPKYKKAQKGKYNNEHLYYAFGQTDSGRYLLIVFIYKKK